MKKHFRYSILVMLAIVALMTLSVVNAAPLIGGSVQVEPYESNPAATAYSGVGTPSGAISTYDGDLFTSGTIPLGSGFGTTGYFEWKTFDNMPPGGAFTIEWVDIKIKYQVPSATVDDPYKFEYTVGAAGTWQPLTTDVSGADSLYDFVGNAAVRPWSGVAEPTDGVWDWADILGLRVRLWVGPRVGGWDGKNMYVFEVWASVYSTAPKTGSTVVSVHPDMVLGVRPGANPMAPPLWDQGFVDLYITDVASMGGYEIVLEFDTALLTPIDWFSYYPFVTTVVTAELNDAAGYVALVQWTYFGDPDGFTGDTPMARIYFACDGGGWSDLHYATDKISDAEGISIAHQTYDGTYSQSRVLSAVVSDSDLTPLYIDPTAPIGTWWHELYPTYSIVRQLVGWIDNTDGYLSPSDQITMDEDGILKDYHVDDMRITIHWTFKPDGINPDPGNLGAAEPWELLYELPPNPIGTIWHQVYPVYCRYFEITSWEDNGDTVFSPSDQFDFMYYDEPYETAWAHLDSVSIDIFVTEKPTPPVPEFPFGLVMLLAPAVPIAYLWRTRKKVK